MSNKRQLRCYCIILCRITISRALLNPILQSFSGKSNLFSVYCNPNSFHICFGYLTPYLYYCSYHSCIHSLRLLFLICVAGTFLNTQNLPIMAIMQIFPHDFVLNPLQLTRLGKFPQFFLLRIPWLNPPRRWAPCGGRPGTRAAQSSWAGHHPSPSRCAPCTARPISSGHSNKIVLSIF